MSLSTGVHPDLLKIAKSISPIYKKGSKLDTSNYSPISLLSNLNKILEKSTNSLKTKNASITYNLDFVKNIEITENIRKSLDNKKYAC